MAFVVLLGPFQGPPDTIVGPFETNEAADEYALRRPGDSEGRYAAVMPLVSPSV